MIQQRCLHDHPPAGLLSRARILVSQEGSYELQVLLRTIEKGTICSEDELNELAEKIDESTLYKFCPGLNLHEYREQYAEVIWYDSKSVKLIVELFTRVESHHCQMWRKLARNASIFEKDQSEVLCQPCKKMRSHLD